MVAPAEGIEAEVGPAVATTRRQAGAQQLGQGGHIQGLRPQVVGEQHQPLPAAAPMFQAVEQGFIAPFTGMEQQRCRIGIEQGRRLRGDGHQGIGEQQGTGGPVKAGVFQKGAQAQIQWSQGQPAQLVSVGQSIHLQHLGAAGRKAQQTGRQGQGEAPLVGRDPDLGLGEGPGHGRHRQLVLQARGGREHDRTHGPMQGLQPLQLGPHVPGHRHRGVEHQPLGHLEHGHADRYRHVPDPLQLLETPDPAGNQLPNQGAAVPIGIEG